MSREAVEAILGKAMLDGRFREQLFANPDEALAEYDLTGEEATALRAIDFETMESFAGTLDERISKAGVSLFAMIDGVIGPGAVAARGLADDSDLGLTGATGINLPK